MGLLLAAAPFEEWARENTPFLGVVVIALIALLVFRLVARAVTRMLLLGILLLITVFIAAERDEISRCSQTCRCEPAGVDISIAYCDPLRGRRI